MLYKNKYHHDDDKLYLINLKSTKLLFSQLFVIRLLICVVITFETLIYMGLIHLAHPHTLTLAWITYIILGYVFIYELPLVFIKRHTPYYTFIGWLYVLTMLLDLFGNAFNFFARYPYYDDLIHLTTLPWLLTSVSLALSSVYCLKHRLKQVPSLLLILAFLGAMTLTSVHEMIELLIDWLTASNAGTAATDIGDTARDIVCNTIGSVSFLLGFYLFGWKKWLRSLDEKSSLKSR